jgi:Protein of unknown function (DUF4019)
MKKFFVLLLAVLVCRIVVARSSATVPFTIDATEDVADEFPGAPRLQSFSFAQWKGRWVFIGGRISGYHAVGGGSAEFLQADANRNVWVIDTTVKPAKTYHVPVAQLPTRLAMVGAQWASTGQLYFQDGEQLYICGGYGQDENGNWSTFDAVSRVSVPTLIEGVMHGRIPAESVSFGRSRLVQSAGGGLTKLSDGYFYLVMGHSFQGSYTAFEGRREKNSAEASQTYLDEIRKLSLKPKPDGSLSVTLVEKFHDEMEFHRRDFNIAQFLSPAGLGFAAYGGVFTPDTQLSYSKPVYVHPGSRPSVDSAFDQKMNAYSSAILLMHSETTKTMYTTFFGGISRFSWNPLESVYQENPIAGNKAESKYLDGLQWSDQISTIQKDGTGTSEVVHSRPLPAFLGTGAVFIPVSQLARGYQDTDILEFDSLKGRRTFVGYIYGGIRAYPYEFPYLKTAPPHNSGAVPSKPSDMILKVYVQPASIPGAPLPEQDAATAGQKWLSLVDDQKNEESWNQASSMFRSEVTQAQWVAALKRSREPLGSLVSRTPSRVQFSKSLRGAPDGDYAIIHFTTSFTNKSATERLTLVKEDGRWQMAAYGIY